MNSPAITIGYIEEIRRIAVNTQYPGGSINNAPGNCNIETFLLELVALRKRQGLKKTKVLYAANYDS